MPCPNKVGEQLSYELPIVAGFGGITGSMLHGGGLPVRYETGDEVSAAAALARLVRRPSDPNQTVSAPQTFKEFFNPERIYPECSNHLELVTRSYPHPKEEDAR